MHFSPSWSTVKRYVFSNPQSGRRGLGCAGANIPTSGLKRSWLALFSEGRRGDLRAIWDTLQDVGFWTVVFQRDRFDNFLRVNGEEEWTRLESCLNLTEEERKAKDEKQKENAREEVVEQGESPESLRVQFMIKANSFCLFANLLLSMLVLKDWVPIISYNTTNYLDNNQYDRRPKNAKVKNILWSHVSLQQFFLQLETPLSVAVTKVQRSFTRTSWFSFLRSSIPPSWT